MQKFTRPLTREIELAGERLAVTLSAEGLSVRPVGSRKPPLEAGWAEIVRSLTARGTGTGPTPEELKAAVEALKKGGSAKSASSPSGSAPARAAPAPGAQPAGTATMADLLSRLQKWLAKQTAR